MDLVVGDGSHGRGLGFPMASIGIRVLVLEASRVSMFRFSWREVEENTGFGSSPERCWGDVRQREPLETFRMTLGFYI